MTSLLTPARLPLLIAAAGLLGALAILHPAQAAPPQSTPWIHTVGPAHLGYQLYWWDGFTAERDASVTGYDVEYRETGTTSWSSWPHSGTVRAVEFSNLDAGKSYQARVRATNGDGGGPWSEVKSMVAVVDYSLTPNAPFPLLVEAGDAQASVTWGLPSHNGGKTLTGYEIRLRYADGETVLRTVTVSGAATTSATITGLDNHTAYDIDMYATYGGAGGGGLATPRVDFTPTAPQTLPTGVALSLDRLDITEGDSGAFTIALFADPGASTTVTLVRTQYFQAEYGEPGHDWDLNAASVSPETLTFSAGDSGNWGDPRTVTVSGVEDADAIPEQLIILVLVQTSAASGYENPEYEPVGGPVNAVAGVFVTVADDDLSGAPPGFGGDWCPEPTLDLLSGELHIPECWDRETQPQLLDREPQQPNRPAEDADGNRVSDTFDVSVEPEPAEEEAPRVVAPLPDISFEEEGHRAISLAEVFQDPEGQELAFSVKSSDYGVVRAWNSGDSHLALVVTGNGTATVTVTARDPDGNEVSHSFEVTVTPFGG